MHIDQFTNTDELKTLTGRVQALRASGKRYSDIEDGQGHQYVDLVQEGGGVLGIALVGYTYIMEQAGIRFFSLAGTSAGAINTMLLAALSPIGHTKATEILKILSEKNLFDLVDGSDAVQKLLQKALNKEGGIGWFLIFNGLKLYKTLKHKLGLNPGSDFVAWISGELQKAGIDTLADLQRLRQQLPEGLKNVQTSKPLSNMKACLAIIAADITTNTKVEFPRMAKLYWQQCDQISPALIVRASMSIPFFFEPTQVHGIPDAGKSAMPDWETMASYDGPVPPSVRFVDGGLLSNFPINVFHRTDGGVPRMPTFGARLSAYRESYNTTDTVFKMSGAMISTMRQIYDYDFLLKNPDYRHLICRIDADQSFNWLNFNMSTGEQVALFTLGARKAVEFLENFDWEAYKNVRRALAAPVV